MVCNSRYAFLLKQAPRQVDKLPNIIILEYANMPWYCTPLCVCAYIYIFYPHIGGEICSILTPYADTRIPKKNFEKHNIWLFL